MTSAGAGWRSAYLELPLAIRLGAALVLVFTLTQVEAAYERHREYAPVAAAESAADETGRPVAHLPFGLAQSWVSSGVGEASVRERWRSGNSFFDRAFLAVARPGAEPAPEASRCYAFPVTGEVRTRLRGTVYLARFCYTGEAPGPAPVVAAVLPVEA